MRREFNTRMFSTTFENENEKARISVNSKVKTRAQINFIIDYIKNSSKNEYAKKFAAVNDNTGNTWRRRYDVQQRTVDGLTKEFLEVRNCKGGKELVPAEEMFDVINISHAHILKHSKVSPTINHLKKRYHSRKFVITYVFIAIRRK